jgi:RNA methyltransferase, TrmH family
MERIASRQNPLVRRFRELSSKGGGDGVLLDGEHLLREALASQVPIEVAVFADAAVAGAHGSHHALEADVARQGGRVVSVSAAVLAAMSPVRQPSGVAAIAMLPKGSLNDALGRTAQLVLLLSAVQDPGNVGAIVRAGEAYGVTGIIAGEGTADPYGWKAVRGSMGSVFRMPIAARVPLLEAARAAKANGIRIVAAVPRDGEPLPDIDLRRPSAILLGGEGAGLPEPLLQIADAWLTIPMRPPVESLNVGVAAALIAYEASRQRAERRR